jgi:hypothetical protein
MALTTDIGRSGPSDPWGPTDPHPEDLFRSLVVTYIGHGRDHMKLTNLFIVTAALALGGTVHAQSSLSSQLLAIDAVVSIDIEGHSWIAEKEDNICGIKDLKKVTKPALVDYEELLEATPQMKEIKRDEIDPGSTKGKALRKAARTLISKTAEVVRKENGHCGIWKAIAHKDAREIADVTEDIVERF